MLSEDREYRKGNGIARHGDQGSHRVGKLVRWMFGKVTATQQGTLQEILARASGGRNQFICNCIIAPNESAALVHHSTEKINVLSRRIEMGSKGWLIRVQNAPREHHISRTCLRPTHLVTSAVRRTVKEPSIFHP